MILGWPPLETSSVVIAAIRMLELDVAVLSYGSILLISGPTMQILLSPPGLPPYSPGLPIFWQAIRGSPL